MQPDPKKPQSLAEWNDERRAYWDAVKRKITAPETVWNGLLCDVCGGKMYDTGQTMGTIPETMRVRCTACGCRADRLE